MAHFNISEINFRFTVVFVNLFRKGRNHFSQLCMTATSSKKIRFYSKNISKIYLNNNNQQEKMNHPPGQNYSLTNNLFERLGSGDKGSIYSHSFSE